MRTMRDPVGVESAPPEVLDTATVSELVDVATKELLSAEGVLIDAETQLNPMQPAKSGDQCEKASGTLFDRLRRVAEVAERVNRLSFSVGQQLGTCPPVPKTMTAGMR